MPQLSYPGVYIQEKSSGVKTITGVATSIAAFFGRSAKGPLNKAVRCLSFADYVRNFGSPHLDSDLSASMRQFFDNGGTDCYVVRLAHNARKASTQLRNYATAARIVLRATAKQEGVWGNGVRLEVDYNTPNPGETFNLRVIQEEGGRAVADETFPNLSMDRSLPNFAPSFVTQSSQLIDLELATGGGAELGDPAVVGSFYNSGSIAGYSEARRPLGTNDAGVRTTFNNLINPAPGNPRFHSFDISVNGSAYRTVSLASWNPILVAITTAQIATELQNRINAELLSLVPAPAVTVTVLQGGATVVNDNFLLRITANDAAGILASVKVRRAAANDISSALLLGNDNGGIEFVRRSNFRPAPTGTVLRIDDPAGAAGNLIRLNTIAGLLQNQLTQITIDGITIALDAGANSIVTTALGDRFYQDGIAGASPSNHNDGVREKLRRVAAAISNAPQVPYRAEVQGYQLVIIPLNGSINQQPVVSFTGPGAAAFTNALALNTRQYTLGPGSTSNFATGAVGGTDDDGNPPDFNDYLGDPVLQTGFRALDTVDLFNLMILPADRGISDATRQDLWGPASIYCQSRRAFLLMDAPDSWATSDGRAAIVQNSSQVNDLRARVIKDYSAVFFPKLKIKDRGLMRTIGSTGSIAGLLARTDASRGVWKAPAGTEADLRGIAGFEVKLTDMENGVLNKLGVNCLRNFPSGFVNWGARTMDGSDDIGSEWKYIPIRRLALFIEESLYRGTQWVVFEPNDEPLWAKIRLNVGVFMSGLFRQGAFQGSTKDQAYYVKCDAETTTQADRNLGIVNIEVGFAPLKPAEFVVITIQQIAGDLK